MIHLRRSKPITTSCSRVTCSVHSSSNVGLDTSEIARSRHFACVHIHWSFRCTTTFRLSGSDSKAAQGSKLTLGRFVLKKRICVTRSQYHLAVVFACGASLRRSCNAYSFRDL